MPNIFWTKMGNSGHSWILRRSSPLWRMRSLQLLRPASEFTKQNSCTVAFFVSFCPEKYGHEMKPFCLVHVEIRICQTNNFVKKILPKRGKASLCSSLFNKICFQSCYSAHSAHSDNLYFHSSVV